MPWAPKSVERSADAARVHATQRIVMFTPAARHELQTLRRSAFTGYLVKPLRAASLAARLATARRKLPRRALPAIR